MPAARGGIGRTLGFGFLIGARDDGATRTVESVGRGFVSVAEGVARAVREMPGIQRMGNLINALSLRRLNEISGGLQNIADRAGQLSGQVSSTSLESFGAEFAQTYRSATAGLGQFRGAVDEVRGQISSLAFSLNVDSGEMINFASSVARAGYRVSDFGLNMRSVAGSIQANILQGQQLGTVLTGLARSYDLGADGATRVLDTVTALGNQFGVGADAARALPEIMQAVDQAAAQFPEIGRNVDATVESITRLALANQRRLGGDFTQNVQNAVNVFSQLAETRGQLTGLISGLNTEFPELASRIAEIAGVDFSLDSVLQDPVRFAASMAQIYQTMDAGSVQAARLRDVLRGMGEPFNFLIQGGAESAQALEIAMGSVENVEGAFSRMSRSASGSTRTFSESMDLLEESFRARVDRMARQHYPRFEQQVLQRQRTSFDRLGETINRISSGTGPFAALTRTMIATRRGGLQGLVVALDSELSPAFPRLAQAMGTVLPLLDGVGSGLLEVASQAFPAIVALDRLGVRLPNLGGAFGLLINPVTVLGAGIYLLIRYWDRLEPRIREGTVLLEGAASRFASFAERIDWEAAGRSLIDGILQAFSAAGDAVSGAGDNELATRIGRALGSIFRTAGGIVRDSVRGMWERTVEWIFEPREFLGQVQRGAAALGVALGGAIATPLRGPLFSALQGVFGGLGRVASQLGAGRALAGTALRTVVRGIPGIGAILGVLFDLPEIISTFQTGSIVDGVRAVFDSILNGVLLGIPRLIENLTGTDLVDQIFGSLFEFLNIDRIAAAFGGGDYVRGVLEVIFGPGLGRVVQDYVQSTFGVDLFGEIASGLESLTATVTGVFSDIWDAYTTNAAPVWNSWMSGFREIGDIMSEVWTTTIQPLWNEIGTLLSGVFRDIVGMFVSDSGNVESRFSDMGRNASLFGSVVENVLSVVGPALRWLADGIIPLVVGAFRMWAVQARIGIFVLRGVVAAAGLIWRVLRPVVNLFVWWFGVLARGPAVFVDIWNAASDAFSGMGEAVSRFWQERVVPAYNYVKDFWRDAMAAVWNAGERAFSAIGDFIGSVIDRVRGWFGRLRDRWEEIVVRVRYGALLAFNYLLTVATRAISAVVETFNNLRQRWEATRRVLATGFELIGAKITQFFLRPVLRVGDTFSTITDNIRLGFLQMKIAVIDMINTLFGRLARMEFLPERLRNMFASAASGLDDMATQSRTEVANILVGQVQRRVQHEIAMAEAQRRAEELTAAFERDRAALSAEQAQPTASRGTPARQPVVTVRSAEEENVARETPAQRYRRRQQANEQARATTVAIQNTEMGIAGFSNQAVRQLAGALQVTVQAPRTAGAARPSDGGISPDNF